MSTTIHPGKCKFCGATLRLEIDDDCPAIEVEKWKPIAACDRCADFRMLLFKLGDYCEKLLGKLHDARGGKNEKEVEGRTRELLAEATKRIMRIICDHYRVQNYWEPSVVDEMIEHPNAVRAMIVFLRQQVQNHKRRSQA